MAKKQNTYRTCSFCGREIPRDKFIIGGLDAMICSDCLEAAMDIFHQHQTETQHKAISDIKLKLLKPKEIKEDKYIGNEYMRIYPYIRYYDGTDKYKNGELIPEGYYVKNCRDDKSIIVPLSEWLNK